MEEQIDGARDVAAVDSVPKDPPEKREELRDDGGPEPFDETCEDVPENRVREGAEGAKVLCDDSGPESFDEACEDTQENRVRGGARVSLST